MGFVILALIGLATAATLWRLGHLRGAGLQLTLAAILLGSAGYILQGRPLLAGSPRDEGARPAPMPLTAPRQAMLGRFNQADRWLIIADSFASRGKTEDAVKVLQSAIRAHPDDFALWIGLGNALVDHSGMNNPAATLAFQRARELAPNHPAPLFFQGLALARSGQQPEALAMWRQAQQLTPAGVSYRPMIDGMIGALEAQAAARAPAR